MSIKKKVLIPVVLIVGMTTMTGCQSLIPKPYDKPEFVEVKPNQTAFVIPLEGKTSDQGKFESEEILKKQQVATKRIEVSHKWVQTGRWSHQGEWVDTVRVLVVDRYPETRQWAREGAFVGESKDSVKFNQGISSTAQITEEDTAKYLYQNAGKTLKTVMDNEIHDYIGSVLLEEYSKRAIEDIRGDKSAILKAVKEKVVPYFKEKGITITNLGYVDDMVYLDPAIQQAINKKFNAQEDAKAQAIINEKNEKTSQSELVQAQKKAQAMKTLEAMKSLEIQETLAKGLAEGKIVLPQTLIMGEGQEMIFDLPVKTEPATKK